MYASRAAKLDVMKYLVEECKADINARHKVKHCTHSNRLLVWFGSTQRATGCWWISFAASDAVCTDRCCYRMEKVQLLISSSSKKRPQSELRLSS